MNEFNKILFPFWLAFAVTGILYTVMEQIRLKEVRCRQQWEHKGVEIKSIVDSCVDGHRFGLCVYFKSHFSPVEKWGNYLHWTEMVHLSRLEGIMLPNDSVYKPAGSFKFYVFKHRKKDSCIVVEVANDHTIDDWACKDCKDYYEMFNQSKK